MRNISSKSERARESEQIALLAAAEDAFSEKHPGSRVELSATTAGSIAGSDLERVVRRFTTGRWTPFLGIGDSYASPCGELTRGLAKRTAKRAEKRRSF